MAGQHRELTIAQDKHLGDAAKTVARLKLRSVAVLEDDGMMERRLLLKSIVLPALLVGWGGCARKKRARGAEVLPL